MKDQIVSSDSPAFEEKKPLISQAVLDLLKNEGLTDDQAMVIIIWCKWRLALGGLDHHFKSI